MDPFWWWYYAVWGWAALLLPIVFWFGLLAVVIRMRPPFRLSVGGAADAAGDTAPTDSAPDRGIAWRGIATLAAPILGGAVGEAVFLWPLRALASGPNDPTRLIRVANIEELVLMLGGWAVASAGLGLLAALFTAYVLLARRARSLAGPDGLLTVKRDTWWFSAGRTAAIVGLVVTAALVPLLGFGISIVLSPGWGAR